MYEDPDELQLVPSVILLVLSGTLGLMLALQGAVLGSPLAAPAAALSAILLASGGLLRPSRSWSLRAATWVAPAAGLVWLATFVVEGAPDDLSVAGVSAAMIGASIAVRRQLLGILAGPAWLRARHDGTAAASRPAEGWIEELDEAA
jgi:hypothetical protein